MNDTKNNLNQRQIELRLEDLEKQQLELKQSEDKYRAIIMALPDMIFIHDREGRFLDYSVHDDSQLFMPPGNFIGTTINEVMPGDICQKYLSLAERAFMTGKLQSFEYSLSDDNIARYFEARMVVCGEDRILSIIRDISGKKIMENQLFQAHKMEAVGQLAGGVAHDFNNMLVGMMGNAEMLAMKLVNEPSLSELAARIVTSAEHAANLTKQLLSFSRKGKYQMIPVNIHQTVGSVASILSNTLDRKVQIKQFFKAPRFVILGDSSQLENIFLNLGLNARDAMPQGGDLTFSTDLVELDANYVNTHHYKMDPGFYVQISVTDTGTGMDHNTKQHLFEPFFTTKAPGKGTGLGLASVYGTVKNHNGSIEVYSELGYGTTVKIYLPAADAEFREEECKPAQVAQCGTERILLVDDEEMIRITASQILENLGYTVRTCQDGREAVDYYRKHHGQVDLVILDMIMPQMNGRETFEEMKKINPEIRALLSSGFSAEGEAQEILKDGVKDFVQKPFRIAELTSKVRKALG